MVDKNNEPHGFCRWLCTNRIFEGQFKHGKKHGYSRCIWYDGNVDEFKHEDGKSNLNEFGEAMW